MRVANIRSGNVRPSWDRRLFEVATGRRCNSRCYKRQQDIRTGGRTYRDGVFWIFHDNCSGSHLTCTIYTWFGLGLHQRADVFNMSIVSKQRTSLLNIHKETKRYKGKERKQRINANHLLKPIHAFVVDEPLSAELQIDLLQPSVSSHSRCLSFLVIKPSEGSVL